METFIIYITGVILSYILGRKIIRGIQIGEYGYSDVLKILLFSLGSYVMLFFWIVVYIIIETEDKKPPKWL